LVKGKRRIQSDGLVQTRIKSFFTNSIQIRGPEDGHRVENIVTLPGVNLSGLGGCEEEGKEYEQSKTGGTDRQEEHKV
jgi:hypothetical protein